MIRLSGLWKSTSKNGKVYYAGSINKGCRILIFPNQQKTNDSQPDFEVFIDAPVQKEVLLEDNSKEIIHD